MIGPVAKKQPEQLKFKLADMLDDKDRAILDQFLMPPKKRRVKRKSRDAKKTTPAQGANHRGL